MRALLVFPHQLFLDHPGSMPKPDLVVLSEDPLFFRDAVYPARFHFQKLVLHRASMKYYERLLIASGRRVHYFEYAQGASALPKLFETLKTLGVETLCVAHVEDFVLKKRLLKVSRDFEMEIAWIETRGFINSEEQNSAYRSGKKRWFMADFYRWQRQRLNILVDENNKPVGGKWSFDKENQKKLPKKKIGELPALPFVAELAQPKEAISYVSKYFPDSPGLCEAGQCLLYPYTHQQASEWLDEFLDRRFVNFGPYEDAIVEDQNWLYHSVLTPMLNIGLLEPMQVVTRALEFATKHNVPLPSVEGFIRQIIGWREFMRATYMDMGVVMRTTNHWQHKRPMPKAFYTATTGISPIDNSIQRVMKTGYCHHIERLMVLGGFMFLCEIDPDEIYKWFMELFVDSYDWVMVTNVYSMSQHADGGLITTKPYFSGANYVRKMSHYPKGEWCDIWDGLYWRWILKHSKSLAKNPRWAMMVRRAESFDDERKKKHLDNAEAYLSQLDN